jgi:putative PIN family toxin of toxin-antitoxin system
MKNKVSIILDTNVLISSFFGGHPAKIIELIFDEKIDLFYSIEIIREYREVLFRPKFNQISKRKRQIFLNAIIDSGILIEPDRNLSVISQDPADNKFLECGISASAAYLIAGNIHHFNFSFYEQLKIVSPSEFIKSFNSF